MQRFEGLVENAAARDVNHHHYYAESAGRIPESQLQAEFHAHTGMWCSRCAREVLETLMLEHGFTARELYAAWQNDTLFWDGHHHRLEVRTPFFEAVFGWGVVVACLVYFLSFVLPPMVKGAGVAFGVSLMLGTAIYLSSCWMAFRFVLWPRQVGIKVRRVMELEDLRCCACGTLR